MLLANDRSALPVPPPVADGLPGDRPRRRQPTATLIPPLPLVVAAFVLPSRTRPRRKDLGNVQFRPFAPRITLDGAGASHALIKRLDDLAGRRGYELTYSVGWALGEREKAALRLVPEQAWQIAIDGRGEIRERRADDACGNAACAHRACWIEEAHITELTGLLRCGPGGDQLRGWPAAMRVFARRERPHPGAQLTLFEAVDGWRYSLWATNRPAGTKGWLGQAAYIDAAHRVQARVEDAIRTGKDCGIGHFPSVN